jgi:hypothetical protein
MGCQAALFEWAESYDSKVCVLTAIMLLPFESNLKVGLGTSKQLHRTHFKGEY